MAFGFEKALSEALTLLTSTVRPRSTGAEVDLTGQQIVSTSRLAGEFGGRVAGFRMSFTRKTRNLRVSWGRIGGEI